MGIAHSIKSLFTGKQDQKSLTLTDSEIWSDVFGITPTASGQTVSASTALRVPAVACATALISQTVGTVPAKVYIRASKETAREHAAYKLIHDEANEWTSAAQLREQLTLDALMTGHGYAHVVRLENGDPFEMHRLDPSIVTPKVDPDGRPFYIVKLANGERRFEFTDILHISPFGGVSPITLGREAIGLALAFETHIGSLFANGARPSGVIKSPKVLDVEAKKKIAGSWFNTHSGRNAGGTAILDEGLEYEQLSMTLADTQFAENRLEQIREIARVFRVPPTMLFELTRGTWSNTEEMARQFYAITLSPWLTAWSWAYARVLFSSSEREHIYIEFVVDDLLTTNAAARATAYGQYRSMGAMTANEVRAGLNLQPLPEGNKLENPYTTTTPAPSNEAQPE